MLPAKTVVKLTATGLTFNEFWGKLSTVPITVHALVSTGNAAGAKANVNLFTHLAQSRALTLLTQGSSFDDAVAQAERELRQGLGVIHPQNPKPGLELDLLGGDTADNAYLLALSCIFSQAVSMDGGGDAELQALMDQTAADLASDGTLDASRKEQLAAAERKLDAAGCSANLGGWLLEQGSTVEPPSLDQVVDRDKDGQANAVDDDDDNDGTIDTQDCARLDPTAQLQLITGACVADDDDDDDDGTPDKVDCAPLDPSKEILLADGTTCDGDADDDGVGDTADDDDDNDGVPDRLDCAPLNPTRYMLLSDGTTCDADTDGDGLGDGDDCAPKDPQLPKDRICPTPSLCSGPVVRGWLPNSALGGSPTLGKIVGTTAHLKLSDRTVIVDLSDVEKPKVTHTVMTTQELATPTRLYRMEDVYVSGVGTLKHVVAYDIDAAGGMKRIWRWRDTEPLRKLINFATDNDYLYVSQNKDNGWLYGHGIPDEHYVSVFPVNTRTPVPTVYSPWLHEGLIALVPKVPVPGYLLAVGSTSVPYTYHFDPHATIFSVKNLQGSLPRLLSVNAKGAYCMGSWGAEKYKNGEATWRLVGDYFFARRTDGYSVFYHDYSWGRTCGIGDPIWVDEVHALSATANKHNKFLEWPDAIDASRYYINTSGVLRIGELRTDKVAYCDNDTLLPPIKMIKQLGQTLVVLSDQGLHLVENDADGDGALNSEDCAPLDATKSVLRDDGTTCDADTDKDGVGDREDCAPQDSKRQVLLSDGTTCDADTDRDGVGDSEDCAAQDPAKEVLLADGVTCDADNDSDGIGNGDDCAPDDREMPKTGPCPTPALCNGLVRRGSLVPSALGGVPWDVKVLGSMAKLRLNDRTVFVDLGDVSNPTVVHTQMTSDWKGVATPTRYYVQTATNYVIAYNVDAAGTLSKAWHWAPPPGQTLLGFDTDQTYLYVWSEGAAPTAYYLSVFPVKAAAGTPLASHALPGVGDLSQVSGTLANGHLVLSGFEQTQSDKRVAIYDLGSPASATPWPKLMELTGKEVQWRIIGDYLFARTTVDTQDPRTWVDQVHALDPSANANYKFINWPDAIDATRYYSRASRKIRIGELRTDKVAYCDNDTLLGPHLIFRIAQAGNTLLIVTQDGLQLVEHSP